MITSLSLPYLFVSDTVAKATEVNANYAAVADKIAQIIGTMNANEDAGYKVQLWNALEVYAAYDRAISPTDYQTYVRKTDGASATDPKNDSVNWALGGVGFNASQTPTAGQIPVLDNNGGVSIPGVLAASYSGGTAVKDMLVLETTGNGGVGRGVGILLKAPSTGGASVPVARIVGSQRVSSAAADDANLIFLVADSVSTSVLMERARINKDGRLLVGTSTDNGRGIVQTAGPIAASQAQGTGVVDMLDLEGTGNGNSGRGIGILMRAAGSGGSVQAARILALQEATSSTANTAALVFQVADSSTTNLTERARISKTGSLLIGTATDNAAGIVQVAGNHVPATDNARTSGAASYRWSTVYAGTGTINTSDAREKTAVAPLTTAEIAAAKDLSAEIGTYQFLSAIAEKGENQARHHVGMTVQRAIEIMESHGLDPFRYGFICYDQWARLESGGDVIHDDGDRYSFRTEELLMFIARGFDARLRQLEGA